MTPHEEEISAEQAADLLSVSQPYLDGLLDGGEIPSPRSAVGVCSSAPTWCASGVSTKPGASMP